MCEIFDMEVLEEGVLLKCPDCGDVVFTPIDELDEILANCEEDCYDEFYEDAEIDAMIEEHILEEIVAVKEWLVQLREADDVEGYTELVLAYDTLVNM